MIALTHEPIDAQKMIEAAQSPAVGAVLLFLGVTRQHTGDRETAKLHYEAYQAMALQELARLEREACERWPIEDCQIVHRLGRVPLGETSVAIVVASAHREAAFSAGQWLIDTLKVRVPIWKKECWVDGTHEWVHPHQSYLAARE